MKINYLYNNLNQILEGPLVINPAVFHDKRGYFFEYWNKSEFNEILGEDINFKQDNESFSFSRVLRGMHYQRDPYSQCKLVKVVLGEVYDVIVDLRKSSKTYLSWAGVYLSDKNKNLLWIPKGFAHGFLSMTEKTIFQYKVTQFWSKESEITLAWDDERIGINWPLEKLNKHNLIISDTDNNAFSIDEIENSNYNFL